ncbi:MAG: zinc-ribbon domain-containing protein [Eubacteriaceae bacterium]|jgi:DNA-directed RNA polymerase subunit RPC12/RpoP|nr:zinc-ribbon domain-containing protein [Eubacteriaceae bacterium]
MAVAEYKCPNCGAALRFDSSKQKMQCDHCGTDFAVEAIEEYESTAGEDSFDWAETGSDPGAGVLEGVVSYTCPSCGGEIVSEDEAAASSCPYCGNPAVFEKNISGLLKPDAIIPFKLEKKDATSTFESFFRKKFFLPKAFRTQNVLEEIKGIYVPFWLFGCSAQANITFKGMTSTSWSDRNYVYTKTDHYALKRSGKIAFDDVPVDGSTKADDTYMQAIEPFDYSAFKDFEPGYLSGFFADRYDVDAQQCMPLANERIRNSTIAVFQSTCSGYALEGTQNSSIRLQSSRIRYALLPVWMLRVTFAGKVFSYAMNGQTGKFVGKLPTDWGKFWMWLIGLFAAFSAVGGLAAYWIV